MYDFVSVMVGIVLFKKWVFSKILIEIIVLEIFGRIYVSKLKLKICIRKFWILLINIYNVYYMVLLLILLWLEI